MVWGIKNLRFQCRRHIPQMIVGHNRVISCFLIRNTVIFAPPFLWFWKSVDFDGKSLCECKKCHKGRYIWRRNRKRTLLFAYQRHASLSVFNCFALTPRLQHEKHWFCWIFSMFTYLVLPFGSAPFLVPLRTVSYTDVHRSLGHSLGQNAFSKIWLNFLTGKMQEKAPKSTDFGAFYGGQYRTRTCDPMHVKQDRPFSDCSCCKTFPYFQYVWAFRNPHLDST